MDRLKVAALGLRSGGSELSRRLSDKMKELLQPQTQESKMVEEATSDRLEEPNWGLNLRICGLLNRDEFSGTEVMRAVKKRMGGKSAVSQRLSLDLLEACAMNCDKVFSEVASEKVLEEMVRMIESTETEDGNRRRAWELIDAWGKSEDLEYLSVFKQTYMVYWLSIDYLVVAKAAIRCGSYFTVVMYVEHWCEEHFGGLTLGNPDFSPLETLPPHIELLVAAFTQINEPDSIYGVIWSHKAEGLLAPRKAEKYGVLRRATALLDVNAESPLSTDMHKAPTLEDLCPISKNSKNGKAQKLNHLRRTEKLESSTSSPVEEVEHVLGHLFKKATAEELKVMRNMFDSGPGRNSWMATFKNETDKQERSLIANLL